jgi:hypothetical protein
MSHAAGQKAADPGDYDMTADPRPQPDGDRDPAGNRARLGLPASGHAAEAIDAADPDKTPDDVDAQSEQSFPA